MTEEELKQLITSNLKQRDILAKAIIADRQERRKEQAQLYQCLGKLAAAQSSFYEAQVDYYHQLSEIREQQSQIQETLTAILEHLLQSDDA